MQRPARGGARGRGSEGGAARHANRLPDWRAARAGQNASWQHFPAAPNQEATNSTTVREDDHEDAEHCLRGEA